LVHLAHQTIQKQRLLSEEFVQKYSALKSQSQHVWVQAKNTNNFSIFKPYLEQIIEMTRQYALSINPSTHPYDTLLGEYEEGMNMEILDTLFAELKPVLASIKHNPVIEHEPYIHLDQ
jgi:carboxypeptidase Taq